MRNLLVLATASFIAIGGAAFAGEGNGEPFPGPDAAVTTQVGNGVVARSQDPFHYAAPTTAAAIGATPHYTMANQDPFQYRGAGQVVQLAPNTVAQAPASNASPSSQAQRVIAPRGTHG